MGLLDSLFGTAPVPGGIGSDLVAGQRAPQSTLLQKIETAMGDNQNAMMGMGMGLLSGNRATGWQNAMQGYLLGANVDARRAKELKEEAERKEKQQRERAFTESLAKLHPDMAEALRLGDTQTATQLLRFKMEESAAKRAQANSDRSYGLERERLDITKSTAERAANQPREVGGALVAPDPANPGQYRELYRAPGGNDLATAIRTREQEAARLGLKQDSPGYQSFVLTGKMPREDAQPLTATDKKAIMEAEEGALASQGAIESLMRAKELSKKAYAGPMAGTRGYTTSLFGSEGGSATVELDNELKTNALNQLKAIFGGAPTEGERAILMEIQGSSALPAEVREKIYNKAIVLATRRLELNKRRAEEMRTGSYYKSGEPGSGVPSIAPQGDPSVGGAPTRNPPGTGPRLLPPEPPQGGNPVYDLNGNRVR